MTIFINEIGIKEIVELNAANGQGNSGRKMRMVSYVVLLAIVLVLAAIAYIFASPSMLESNTSAEISTGNISAVEESAIKPVESTQDVAAACNAAYSSGDSDAFCLAYRKVDIDGLQVLINCANEELSSQLSGKLPCEGLEIGAKALCERDNLNGDEFVDANGEIMTCAESRLS